MAHRASKSAASNRLILRTLMALALAVAPLAALAEPDPVGRALAARGGVTADRAGASSRGLGRGDPVYEGDVIRTSARGRVQLRLQDGAMVDLEPSSRFEIDTYAGDEGDGNVVMSFLRGAMRTITGAIGGGDGESYEVQTSVATIGVRGTAYALRYCDAACVDEGGDPGIYGRVDEGEIVARGPGGEFMFGAGDYFFLPETGDPRRIVVPPDGVLDGGDDGGGGSGPEGTEEAPIQPLVSRGEDGEGLSGPRDGLDEPGFNAGEDTELDPDAGRPGTPVDAAFSGAFLGSSGFAVFESPGDAEARIDDQGRIVGAEFAGFGFFDASELTFNGEGTTTVTDPETESALFDVTWGSWSADSLPVEEGDPAGLLYAFADPQRFTQADRVGNLTTEVQYGDLGGPALLANDGTSWNVQDVTIQVDFASSEIGFTGVALEQVSNGTFLTVSAGSFGSTGEPAAGIDADGSFAVTGLEGGVLEGPDYTGDLSGRFLGQNAEGALIAFEVREVDGERRIIGTRILGDGAGGGGGGGGDGDLNPEPG